jgi:hypothetical protein
VFEYEVFEKDIHYKFDGLLKEMSREGKIIKKIRIVQVILKDNEIYMVLLL